MNNFNPERRLLVAAVGGLAGFLVLLLAWLIFIRVLASHIFGSSLSLLENLIIFSFVLLVILVAAGIPAWVLGANLWRGLLAGLSAMLVFVFIDVSGGQFNYAPFIEYETVAFIIAVLVTVLIGTVGRSIFRPGRLPILFGVAIVFIVLRFVLPGKDLLVGFVVSILAWIVIPFVAAVATYTKPEDR